MNRGNIDNGSVPTVRRIADQVPEEYRDRVAAIEKNLEYLERLGAEFFPAEYWQQLSDVQVFELFAYEFRKSESEIGILGEQVRRMLEKWIPQAVPPDQWYDPGWQDVWVALRAAAMVSLLNEYHRRRLAVENPWGRPVRAYLVDGDMESYGEVVRLATLGLYWHPEFAKAEARTEIEAIAHVALAERLAPLSDRPNPRVNPEPLLKRMSASIRGDLNRIPDNALHAVKEKLEKEKPIQSQRLLPRTQEEDRWRRRLESIHSRSAKR